MKTENGNDSLEIAFSYLNDITQDIEIISEIESYKAKDILKTIKLANKKLNIAEKENPNAAIILAGDDNNDQEEVNISKIRAGLLFYEGAIRGYSFGERTVAVEKIERSISLMEDHSTAYIHLGLFYADLGQKTKAIESTKRAIEIEPNNMDFKKILDELENTSAFIFRTKAFSGSWKVFLVLLGLSIIGVVIGDYTIFILFCVLAGSYWLWKSKAKSKPTMLN